MDMSQGEYGDRPRVAAGKQSLIHREAVVSPEETLEIHGLFSVAGHLARVGRRQ